MEPTDNLVTLAFWKVVQKPQAFYIPRRIPSFKTASTPRPFFILLISSFFRRKLFGQFSGCKGASGAVRKRLGSLGTDYGVHLQSCRKSQSRNLESEFTCLDSGHPCLEVSQNRAKTIATWAVVPRVPCRRLVSREAPPPHRPRVEHPGLEANPNRARVVEPFSETFPERAFGRNEHQRTKSCSGQKKNPGQTRGPQTQLGLSIRPGESGGKAKKIMLAGPSLTKKPFEPQEEMAGDLTGELGSGK